MVHPGHFQVNHNIETSTKPQHTRGVSYTPVYMYVSWASKMLKLLVQKEIWKYSSFFSNSCNELNFLNFRLQDLYKSILLTDLESALDKKVEQDL